MGGLSSVVLGLCAQWSASAGHARFPVEAEKPGLVSVLQAGRAVGRGELVPFRVAAGFYEFRGRVPAGAFRLGRPRRVEGKVPEAAMALVGTEAAFEHREGRLAPRHALRAKLEELEVSAELIVWEEAGYELRLALEAAQEHAARERTLRFRARGPVPRLLGTTGLRVEAVEGGFALVLPSGHLRPGDVCFVVLRRGGDAVDPARRCWPSRAIAPKLGIASGPRPGRWAAGLRERFDEDLAALRVEARSVAATSPLARGDFRRGRIWTHGEFDLARGLLLLAWERRDQELRTLGLAGVEHLLGRDLSRPWSTGSPGRRLPVRHGARHGFGVLESGHVFLEGALLAGLLGCERLLLARAEACLFTLVDFVEEERPRMRHLRELVWPLRNFELGRRLRPDPRLARAVREGIELLAARHDERLRFLDLPADHLVGGVYGQDLWLVAGLLLPALDFVRARELRRKIAGDIAALPRARGGFATHYRRAPGQGWAPQGRRGDPCSLAFVAEGIAGEPRLAAVAGRMRRRVAGLLPGKTWDRATRLALLLRLAWVRAAVR